MIISVDRSVVALLLILATSAEAVACEPSVYDRREAAKVDDPVVTNPDCSFTDADAFNVNDDEYYLVRYLLGAPVRDIGNGRVAQRLSEPLCGGVTEHLLFVNCAAGESVMIEGVEEPGLTIDGYYVPDFLIRYIQPPYGNAGVTSATTVEDLSQRAMQAGYAILSDVNTYLDTPNRLRKIADRYDVSCGCKLFYPDTVGAQK